MGTETETQVEVEEPSAVPGLAELTPEMLEELRELGRRDLFVFAKGICGFGWLEPSIHMPLCRMLERYEHPEFKRLLVNLPRTWLKTTICSQAYPIWRAIRDPNVKVLLAQNTFTNAVSKLKAIRFIFEKNQLFRMLYPEILPTKDCVWKSESLCVNRTKIATESTFEAAGIRTQVVSRHYDLIIEDDTVAPDLSDVGENNLCPTKEDIAQAIGWHRLVTPLLMNPMESQILVVGTRWFEEDLISWITKHEPRYKTYVRACLENKAGEPSEDGEPTYPQRFGPPVLEELKASLGPYMYSCLYLNKPLRSNDMIFRPEWIKHYETEPERRLICTTTVDPAGDPEESQGDPDFNVVLTTGKDLDTGSIFVLDYFQEKCNPGELVGAIFDHVRRYHPVKVGLETTQYQKSLKYWINERMRKEGIFFLVEGLTHVKASKAARIMGLQPVFASGSIYIRPWMRALESELLAWPLGRNDDLIDALASQLELWRQTPSKKELRSKTFADDPLSFDAAVKNLQDLRRGTVVRGSVMDVAAGNPLAVLQFWQ